MTQHAELTPAEMDAETAAALPDREAMSLLDITANLDLSLDLAAPIDAAIAANANVAAPIEVPRCGAGWLGDELMIVVRSPNGLVEDRASPTLDEAPSKPGRATRQRQLDRCHSDRAASR